MAKGKVASVFVSLGLDTAAFSSNWEKATRLGAANAKELERSFKLVGNAVLGMSGAAVTGLGYLVKKQIDVADNAKKMSE